MISDERLSKIEALVGKYLNEETAPAKANSLHSPLAYLLILPTGRYRSGKRSCIRCQGCSTVLRSCTRADHMTGQLQSPS